MAKAVANEQQACRNTAVERAKAHAPFLARLLRRFPEWEIALRDGSAADFLAAMSEPTDMQTWRRTRSRLALGTAIGDLSGEFDLTDVTAGLSDFAERAIEAALTIAMQERVPDANPHGIVALALGKLGSRELNYSSDVDLIFIYDGDRLPRRDNDDPADAAVRYVRRASALLQQPTPDGYVARVDLRLRPDAEANPVAIPLRRAELYYQAEALTWERAAFIRARAVAGDIDMGNAFLERISPFVWRRSLDFTAVADIESMSLSIRDHYDEGQSLGPGFDLKRGRGGIREIEFFAQTNQLIFGGRDERLRHGDTRAALAALADADIVEGETATKLVATYEHLRTLEHRIQMREDEQTHAIPTRKADRAAVAELAGFDDYKALEADLRPQLAFVATSYDTLTHRAEQPKVPRGKALETWLRKLPKAARDPLATLIPKWRGRGYPALRSDAAQREFERALPIIVAAMTKLGAPGPALRRFDDFLSRLPTAFRFFALVAANPPLADLLARVMGNAPSLAGQLARRSALFDAMLGAGDGPPGDADELLENARRVIGRSAVEERQLDAARHWSGEQRFRVGVALLSERISPSEAARAYANIADAAIVALSELLHDRLSSDHGQIPGAAPIVLALGRYGGQALTEASDLDLVFLFAGPHDVKSIGDNPISAANWYNRFFQRLVSALTVPTAAGPLYEIDTRLRPSGVQGLLAVSVDSFEDYQRNRAWTWEHMAVTRARVVVGADTVALEGLICDILRVPREEAILREDVTTMRAEMNAAHPQKGPLDVKRGHGGLIDLEFIVHYRQLASGVGLSPRLADAIGALIADGQLAADFAMAHQRLADYLVVARLVGEAIEGSGGRTTRALVARLCGADEWSALKADLAAARRTVRAEWKRQFGKALR
ncbi:MAG: bifunctional [glutamate--ammonia ligase]-adenylyl-L-tyrosine phosphorylase/[glutamate--ammonia-ligase] adenylyltransferase [Pacificimonas sp.]